MVEERDPRTYAIIGAAMEAHRELGPGFLERVYQEALEIEFKDRGIKYRREAVLPIHYKRHQLRTEYKADFLCMDEVVVETKGQSGLTAVDDAQLIHYLNATGYQVGLLLNFGAPSLQFKRMVRT